MNREGTQVTDFQDRFLFSLSQLSSAFGPARETIGKRLRAAGVKPHSKRGGHDVYHIGAAASAIIEAETPAFDGIDDPDKLPPKERLDWFKSENERNKLQRDSGELIPEEKHRQALAAVVKMVVMTLETLGDDMERNGVIDTEILQRIERTVDEARERLAEKLEAADDVC